MNCRTLHEVMVEKIDRSSRPRGPAILTIPFQKWVGWKTPNKYICVQSYLAIERHDDESYSLYLTRGYADDESNNPWRDLFAFDYAGDLRTLSEILVEIKIHPVFEDPDYPLVDPDYDMLIDALPELVANDALIRTRL